MLKALDRHPRRFVILLTSLALLMVPSHPQIPDGSLLEDIRARDFVQVYTRNTPMTYYQGRQGPAGFEYELTRRFANHLGVSLALDSTGNIEEILTAVRSGDADLGAAALPLNPTQSGILFSRAILTLQPQVVYRRGLSPIREPEDLLGRSIGALRGSGASLVLQELQSQLPGLSWMETTDLEIADLLELVEEGELDAAVVYTHQFKSNRLFFPDVESGFTLGEPLSLAWALPADRGLSLLRQVNRFIDEQWALGALDDLIEQNFGHDDYLEYVGARFFIRQARERLPMYEEAFREAARNTGLDWKLLAALGYQESHWRKHARSPTGVRGIMMLTLPTAKEVGIKNRLDPLQSIDGGARYLLSVKERIPEEVLEPDRTFMALAAYNVGLGHLQDAQKIVEMRGGDPYIWADVREALPLLQKREWYSKVRYGYARGGEPVIYVRNIRRYYEILNYLDRSQRRFYQLNERQPYDEPASQLFDVVPPVL